MTKKFNTKIIYIVIGIIILLVIVNRIKNGVMYYDSPVPMIEDIYFKITLNDKVIHSQVEVNRTYNLIPGILKVNKSGYVYSTYNENMEFTHERYVVIDTKNVDKLILNIEGYKCYKNKFMTTDCEGEVDHFKKIDINIDEVTIKRLGISSDKYNELVYKGPFGRDVYPYVKDTDYYYVTFSYSIGKKKYKIYSEFFTNELQSDILSYRKVLSKVKKFEKMI